MIVKVCSVLIRLVGQFFRPSNQIILDEELYLKANPDVVQAIADRKFKSPYQHFISHGKEEVQTGLRVLAPGLGVYDEDEYLIVNPDIRSLVSNGELRSGFEHYLLHGFREMREGRRVSIGRYIQLIDDNFFDKVKPHIDIDMYAECQSDLSSGEGTFFEKGDAWKHFQLLGAQEILDGKRRLYRGAPEYNYDTYIGLSQDIIPQLNIGVFRTPFEHYVCHGALEIVEGKRFSSLPEATYLYWPPQLADSTISEIQQFNYRPLISIVMPVYNVEPRWLRLAYESIANQWYDNWELCVCDDASTDKATINFLRELQASDDRVKVVYSGVNGNISVASNKALALADGDFIALMDNDDELTVDALYEVVKRFQYENIDFVYSDEDKISMSGDYTEPHFKPDFSPEMFLSHNYLSHLGVIRRSLVEQVGGWQVGFEGAQDYDLYLRVLELTDRINHIPKVLYHWRKIPGSTASEFGEKSYAKEAGRNALQAAMARRNIEANVDHGITLGTYRVRYSIKGEHLVSIIIPFKDKPELLQQCLDSILKYDTYSNFEVICVDNESTDPIIPKLTKLYSKRDRRIRFVSYNCPFNYSAINNFAVNEYANGEYILLMNNDIEVKHEGWIEGMLEHAQNPSVGAVGAKLLYPNNTIQHAGIVLAPDTGHGVISPFQNFSDIAHGYFSRLQSVCNYSAVTAALLLVKKSKYLEVGGFDETNLKIAYNDVDLCLQLINKGYRNVYTPYVTCYHHESASRGYEITLDKKNRMRREQHALKTKNNNCFSKTDPYYSPNLSPYSASFVIDQSVSIDAAEVLGQPFEEAIILDEMYRVRKSSKVCVFAHFDKDGLIDEYVIYNLKELSKYFDIIFVSTAEKMTKNELSKLGEIVFRAIVKENIGYDFGSWKSGIDRIQDELDSIEGLLLCNDSVYGPYESLDTLVSMLGSQDHDVMGISDNFELDYHLQSYFLYFSRRAFLSDVFKQFWENFQIYRDKQALIRHCEIGLSRELINAGLKLIALMPAEKLGYVNNMHYNWARARTEYDCPYMKIELLKDNPLDVDLNSVDSLLGGENHVLMPIVEKHLDRVCDQGFEKSALGKVLNRAGLDG